MATYIKNNPLKLILSLLVVLTIILSSGWPPAWAAGQANVNICKGCGADPCPTGSKQAPCGKKDHYTCDNDNHDAAGCGVANHYECDGKEHYQSCAVCFENMCTGDHSPISGTECGHLNCDPDISSGDDHSKLPCDIHFACLIPEGEDHSKCTVSGCNGYMCEKDANGNSLHGDCDQCDGSICDGANHSLKLCGQHKFCNTDSSLKCNKCTAANCNAGGWQCTGDHSEIEDENENKCGHLMCEISEDNSIEDHKKCDACEKFYCEEPESEGDEPIDHSEIEDENGNKCGHHMCQLEDGENVDDHKICPTCERFHCEEPESSGDDPIDHSDADCRINGHKNCDELDHSDAGCGITGHKKCDQRTHKSVDCGDSTHFTCDGKKHVPCGQLDKKGIKCKGYKCDGHVHCKKCQKVDQCSICRDLKCSMFSTHPEHLTCQCNSGNSCVMTGGKVDSIYFYFKFGNINQKISGGELFLDIDESNFSPDIYSPKMLQYKSPSHEHKKGVLKQSDIYPSSTSPAIDIKNVIGSETEEKDYITQIRVNMATATVDYYPESQYYYIVFTNAYNTQLGTSYPSPTIDGDGHILNLEQEENYWKIENPDFVDGATEQLNERLKLTKYQKGTLLDTYVFSYNHSLKQWGLASGANSDEIEYLTKREIKDPIDPYLDLRIEHRVKMNKAGQKSSDVESFFYNNSIRTKTIDPNGLNLITNYSQTSQGQNPRAWIGPYGDWFETSESFNSHSAETTINNTQCWLDNIKSVGTTGSFLGPMNSKFQKEERVYDRYVIDKYSTIREQHPKMVRKLVERKELIREDYTYSELEHPPETDTLNSEETIIKTISLPGNPTTLTSTEVLYADYSLLFDKESPRYKSIDDYYYWIDQTVIVEEGGEDSEAFKKYIEAISVPPQETTYRLIEHGGKIKERVNPNQTKETYTYAGLRRIPTDGSMPLANENITYGTVDSPDGVNGKSLKVLKDFTKSGKLASIETYVKLLSGSFSAPPISRQIYHYNIDDKLEKVTNSNGTVTESSYGSNCCGKESQEDSYGRNYSYVYNGAKRLAEKRTYGSAFGADENKLPETTEIYTYDGSGRMKSRTLKAKGDDSDFELHGTSGSSDDTTITLQTTVYDLAGRVTSQTDRNGVVTTYEYTQAIGPGLVQTKRSEGITEIVEYYCDGKVKKITRNNGYNEFHKYEVVSNSEGAFIVQTIYYGDGDESDYQWQRTYTDGLDRTVKVESNGSAPGEVILVTQNFYNEKGQLHKQESDLGPTVFYQYDELGNINQVAKDVDEDGVININSSDVIKETDFHYEQDENGKVWKITERAIYTEPLVEGEDAQRLVTSITKELQVFQNFAESMVTSHTIVIDQNGVETDYITELTNGVSYDKVISPASNQTTQQVKVAGKLVESHTNGIVTSYNYDKFGRVYQVVDPRKGTTTTTYNAQGRVDSITDAANNVTYYEYDDRGNCIKKTDALNNSSYYSYNLANKLTRAWGKNNSASPYPVEFEYDDFGNLTSMKTYQTGDWFNEDWPASPPTPDVTTWTYRPYDGQVSMKLYPNGNHTNYRYDDFGTLSSIDYYTISTNKISTTYFTYDNLGQITEIQYVDADDATNKIVESFVYNRLGQVVQITDDAGVRTFNYSTAGALTSEVITGIINKTISYQYDSLGRQNRFNIDNSNYQIDYTYGTDGRFDTLTFNETETWDYDYLANSNLIKTIQSPIDDLNSRRTYSYEPHRDLITDITSTGSYYFHYENDVLGRRKLKRHSGFSATTYNHVDYVYNVRNEIFSAAKEVRNGDDTVVDSEDLTFNYNDIGARVVTNIDGTNYTSTPNNVNQYTAIENQNGTHNPTYD